MDSRELPSDSDESDEDYVPSGAESNPPSEVESDGDEEDDANSGEEEVEESTRKRKRGQKSVKKKSKKKGRRLKKDVAEEQEIIEPENVETEEMKKLTDEEQKKKADSLWSDFLKDTGTVPRTQPKVTLSNGNSSKKEEVQSSKYEPQKIQEKENKVTITKVFEFAGEEVRVTKEVDADSAEARISSSKGTGASSSPSVKGPARASGGLKGLSSVLGQLGRKPKLGTLEKSKLDWDRFKKAQGIDDEIKAHNRGKEGYLERQDFLQRTDLRQFEREKELRAATQRNNR